MANRLQIAKKYFQRIIESVNQDFIDMCGFLEMELIDKTLNIIRHPDISIQIASTTEEPVSKQIVYGSAYLKNRINQFNTDNPLIHRY